MWPQGTYLYNKGITFQAVEELHLRVEVTRNYETGVAVYTLVKEDDEFINEVETTLCEGMKIYNSYVVQHKARMEIKSNQDKLAKEVKQYPEKLKLFKQQKQDYKAA